MKEADQIKLSSFGTFDKSTKTRLLSTSEGSDVFDLAALVYYWLHKEAGAGEYAKGANENKVAMVSFTDRKLVQELLRGTQPLEGPRIVQSPNNKRPLEEGEVAAAATSTTTTAAKKQRYTVNKDDLDRCKRINAFIQGQPYGFQGMPDKARLDRQAVMAPNRETCLRGDRTNSFESVKAMVSTRLSILKDESKSKTSSSSGAVPSAAAASQKDPSQPQSRKRRADPIILISPSSTALINMYNVKRFLEESVFESPEQARLGPDGHARSVEDVIPIMHVRQTTSVGPSASSSAGAATALGKAQRYFVVDNVESLEKLGGKEGKDAVWDRVVCVFTTGQEWQFKAYKWKQPKELFHHGKSCSLPGVWNES